MIWNENQMYHKTSHGANGNLCFVSVEYMKQKLQGLIHNTLELCNTMHITAT